jgi:Protein of unknown function (DUF3037)
MPNNLQCEFSLIRYVPDVVKGEFANIGVLLREAGSSGGEVRFTRDWSRVRCIDPHADTEMLESLEAEIATRLEAGVELKINAKPVLETLEDSLSNSVQLTAMRGTLTENLPTEMEQLMRMYVEPLRGAPERKRSSGRASIVGEMRDAFERAGVWRLMRKRIRAAEYTQAGDPLRIDCGYRTTPLANSRVRMFQAVSLENDVEMAKGMAYSAGALREGVMRIEGVELELTAIVESVANIADEEQYRFGVTVMEREAIRVLTARDLGRVAETARQELKV